MIEKNIESERGKVYYWTSNKEATTIFFLHGITGNHKLFEQQIESFKEEYNLIVWD